MKKKTKLRRGCTLLLLLLLLLVLFDLSRSEVIESETYVLSSSRLPEEFSGLRIVELADLHGREFGADHCALLARVEELQPDLIAIDGDLFDEHTDLSILEPLLKGLCQIAPTYYVTGNHEWVTAHLTQTVQQMRQWGVHVLANEYEVLTIGQAQIVLAGVHDPNGPFDMKTPEELVEEIRAEMGQEIYIVMLAHRNEALDRWSALGVDVVLTGHGHGGSIRLPIVGGLIGPGRQLLPEYDSGVFVMGRTAMVVSRGLGSNQNEVRLFNHADLPLVVLHTKTG